MFELKHIMGLFWFFIPDMYLWVPEAWRTERQDSHHVSIHDNGQWDVYTLNVIYSLSHKVFRLPSWSCLDIFGDFQIKLNILSCYEELFLTCNEFLRYELHIQQKLTRPVCPCSWHRLFSKHFFQKILEDISPFMGTTETPVLNFW